MKTKEGFMLRQLGEQYVVVALGKASETFHGIIRLNAAGAFLWKELSAHNKTEEQLVDALLERYDTDRLMFRLLLLQLKMQACWSSKYVRDRVRKAIEKKQTICLYNGWRQYASNASGTSGYRCHRVCTK